MEPSFRTLCFHWLISRNVISDPQHFCYREFQLKRQQTLQYFNIQNFLPRRFRHSFCDTGEKINISDTPWKKEGKTLNWYPINTRTIPLDKNGRKNESEPRMKVGEIDRKLCFLFSKNGNIAAKSGNRSKILRIYNFGIISWKIFKKS